MSQNIINQESLVVNNVLLNKEKTIRSQIFDSEEM